MRILTAAFTLMLVASPLAAETVTRVNHNDGSYTMVVTHDDGTTTADRSNGGSLTEGSGMSHADVVGMVTDRGDTVDHPGEGNGGINDGGGSEHPGAGDGSGDGGHDGNDGNDHGNGDSNGDGGDHDGGDHGDDHGGTAE